MKSVVVIDELREVGLRPQPLFDEYITLLRSDIGGLLGDPSSFVDIPCPACGSRDSRPIFEKFSFRFVRCPNCASVFVSPRPSPAMLERFHAQASSLKFWQERFSQGTAQERDGSIFQPRASWISDTTLDHRGQASLVIDIESKYPRLLERITRMRTFKSRVALNPRVELPTQSGFTAIVNSQAKNADAVLLMECLERSFDPAGLVQRAHGLLAEQGLLFMTTVTGSGFDFQLLHQHSKNILPPIHLNLLTVEGISGLLTSKGFEIIELSTPGQLDMEIVSRAVRENPAIILPPVIADIILRREEPVREAFQEFLQRARLSSHLRLVARKHGK